MTERRQILSTLALTALAFLLLAIDIHLPLGVAAGVPYVGVVLLAVWLPNRRLVLYLALLCSLLVIAGAILSPPGGILWVVFVNRGLAILAIWTVAILSWRRRRAEDELLRANRELDAFVHTVSHDLRSPLTPIIGWAGLLREEYGHCLREEGTMAVKEIENQGRRMHHLLEDLLQLARTGHLERPPAPIEVADVVRQVLETRQEEAAQAGSEFRLGALPQVRVPETLLAQVFDNLIGNALRFAGGTGPIEIGGARRGSKVRYFVRDHGPGIAPAEREMIFGSFCRGSTSPSTPGTGIGLATVRKIALHFGGRAWVEDTPGGGSTFWIEFLDSDD